MLKFAFAAAVSAALLLSPLSAAPSFAATNPPAADAKKEPSPGQLAFRDRQKKCGAEWRDLKAKGKVPQGMTWPKYWSECNKRLKGAKRRSSGARSLKNESRERDGSLARLMRVAEVVTIGNVER